MQEFKATPFLQAYWKVKSNLFERGSEHPDPDPLEPHEQDWPEHTVGGGGGK